MGLEETVTHISSLKGSTQAGTTQPTNKGVAGQAVAGEMFFHQSRKAMQITTNAAQNWMEGRMTTTSTTTS